MLIHYSLTALLTLVNVVLAAPHPDNNGSLSASTPTRTGTSAPPCSVDCLPTSIDSCCDQQFTPPTLDRRDTAGSDAPSSTSTAPPMPSNSAPSPTMQARSVPSPTAVTRRSVSGKRSLRRRNVVENDLPAEPTPHVNVIQPRIIKPRDAPSPAQPASTVAAPTPLPQSTASAR